MCCKIKTFLILILFQLFFCTVFSQQKVVVKTEKEWLYFQNDQLQLAFNLNNGLFNLTNNKNEKIITNAYFRANGLQSKDSCEKRTWTVENINDELGKGKALTIKISFANYADILWQVRLYDDKEFLVFNMGIDNDTKNEYHLMSFYPLISN